MTGYIYICAYVSLQAFLSELHFLQPAHADLVSLGTSLCPAAPEERAKQLEDELEMLQRKLHVQNEVLPQRYIISPEIIKNTTLITPLWLVVAAAKYNMTQ